MTGAGSDLDGLLDRLRHLVATGEFLEVYDEATSAIGDRTPESPEEIEVAYLSTLALARSGAPDRAEQQLAHYGLSDTATLPPRLAEDIASLRARIAKDRAVAAGDQSRAELAAHAARLYEDAYDSYGGAFPCINAATMWLVAGDHDRAASLADTALELCREGDDYWAIATRAEAHLLRGEDDAATEALIRADALSRGEHATRASTKRQLELICVTTGAEPSLLAPLANPRVLHSVGHRVAPAGQRGRFPAQAEARVANDVRTLLEDRDIGIGFGSLASGADIIVAEALKDRGAQLHIVLPFSVDEFIAVSVADSGPQWVARFHACLDAADTVRFASDGAYLGDPAMFDFCSAVGMGEAVNRARNLGSEVEMLAVWDGEPVSGNDQAGTAVDVERWRELELPLNIIDTGSDREPGSQLATSDSPVAARKVRAMLFADIAGFSKLGDAEIPIFMDRIMGQLGDCIDDIGDAVLVRQTWGDGLYLVFADVEHAADCALDMQQTLHGIDFHACGLSALRGMRIGAHVGPVFEGWDRVRKELTFFGANVTRAARIEPRTPEGEVYVTHPFAALVALAQRNDLRCQYVGQLPTAKDYGVLPMYVLKRSG